MHGYIDLALTYERDQEALAASEGWSITAGCVFHDHFCLAGPISDPAGVMSATSLLDGFSKIATGRALFHSRADTSATMWKERGFWAQIGSHPWDDTVAAEWYKTSLLNPSDALKAADAAGAYLLTDRATLLRQTALGTVSNTTVFFEPASEHDPLMNSCYALYSPSTPDERAEAVSSFIQYLFSDRGQKVIAHFGNEAGLPLFAPNKDKFARTKLRGGKPVNCRWVTKSKL
jgi:tungstate transport system substrate-binding protein